MRRGRRAAVSTAKCGFCAAAALAEGVDEGLPAPLLEVTAFRNPPRWGKSELNGAVARLAARQGGHVSRAQLLQLGMQKRAIEVRLEVAQMFRVHRGVYAVGHLPTNPLDRAQGALLAAGPRAALFHRSAAAFWGLYQRWPDQVEVVSPLQHRLTTLSARRCGTLRGRDIRTIGGVRVTSPARTLLDIAPRTRTRTLHRFHNELRMRKLISNEQLLDIATRNPLHPGAGQLQKLAGASAGEAKRSQLEVDWQTFATRHRLPAHETNVHVAGERVDVLFTPDRLVIELDGWGTHGTRRAFEQDRDRDSRILAATGIPTMRITYDGLHDHPRKQVQRIHAILARGSTSAPTDG